MANIIIRKATDYRIQLQDGRYTYQNKTKVSTHEDFFIAAKQEGVSALECVFKVTSSKSSKMRYLKAVKLQHTKWKNWHTDKTQYGKRRIENIEAGPSLNNKIL